jgi:hypothetical protein
MATPPIAYTWSPTPALGQGFATVTYTWSTTGAKTIWVTATNAGGTASDTHPFLVEWRKVHLSLLLRHQLPIFGTSFYVLEEVKASAFTGVVEVHTSKDTGYFPSTLLMLVCTLGFLAIERFRVGEVGEF